MKVTVNGKPKALRSGATLKSAISGERYVPGSLISVHLSTERISRETNDFELITSAGSMVLHLDDSEDARVWKENLSNITGVTARWVTGNIVAFGSFPTGIEKSRETRMYRRYDCFFSLGGMDNYTTYMMVARDDHRASYGAGPGRIGRITVGRHILDRIREGYTISHIRPLVSETSSDSVIVTDDLSYRLEEGYSVETNIRIKLDPESPITAEHVLVLCSKGTMHISDATGSYVACSDDMDVAIPEEGHAVRAEGAITVRHSGVGTGRAFIYKEKRQVSASHNRAGEIVNGRAIISGAKKGDSVTVVTDPPRALAVGMTQAEGGRFLSDAGIRQIRTGDASDSAVIVEQTPEQTLSVLSKGEAETFGVPPDRIFRISLDRAKDGASVHYLEKISGLSHKPIGSLKVQFSYEGLPMVTFYGDEMRGKSIFPQDPFRKCVRGDIGLTNQARPHHGLIGIRLEDSKEYGPTGEEPYGTNIIGKFLGDLDRLMDGLKDEDVIYIKEEEK